MSTNEEDPPYEAGPQGQWDVGFPVWAEIGDSRMDLATRIDIRRWLMSAPVHRITAASDELWGAGYATDPIREFYEALPDPGPAEDLSAISAVPVPGRPAFTVLIKDPVAAEGWLAENRPEAWREIERSCALM